MSETQLQIRRYKFGDLFEIKSKETEFFTIYEIEPKETLKELEEENVINIYEIKKLDEDVFRVRISDGDEFVEAIIDLSDNVALVKDTYSHTACTRYKLMKLDELMNTVVVTKEVYAEMKEDFEICERM